MPEVRGEQVIEQEGQQTPRGAAGGDQADGELALWGVDVSVSREKRLRALRRQGVCRGVTVAGVRVLVCAEGRRDGEHSARVAAGAARVSSPKPYDRAALLLARQPVDAAIRGTLRDTEHGVQEEDAGDPRRLREELVLRACGDVSIRWRASPRQPGVCGTNLCLDDEEHTHDRTSEREKVAARCPRPACQHTRGACPELSGCCGDNVRMSSFRGERQRRDARTSQHPRFGCVWCKANGHGKRAARRSYREEEKRVLGRRADERVGEVACPAVLLPFCAE